MLRIGWSWTSVATVYTDEGVQLQFGEDPPKLFEFHVKASVRRQAERSIAKTAGLSRELRADLLPLSRVLRSKAKDGLPQEDKVLLKCIAADALWPAKRRAEAGYDTSPTCLNVRSQ